MNQEARQLFEDQHDYIARQASERYNLSASSVSRLGSFESAVYSVANGSQEFILKATHDQHRLPEQIQAELEWVNFLAENGVSVCRAIRSRRNQLVETLTIPDSPRTISLILYEKAPGNRLTVETCTERIVERWGETAGQMHSLTRDFRPGPAKRHHWFDDVDCRASERVIAHDPTLVDVIERLVNRIKLYPTSRDTYGLVHIDLHQGNFHVDGDTITVFDTDDCQYDYFANDITMPLFYYFSDSKLSGRQPEKAAWFLRHFLCGYRRHHAIASEWLERIPEFIKLRLAVLYMILVDEDIVGESEWTQNAYDWACEALRSDDIGIDLNLHSM